MHSSLPGVSELISVFGEINRRKKASGEEAEREVARLAAQGCLAYADYSADPVRVVWYAADHPASIAHFASPKQHPGALTRRQLRLIKRTSRL